MIFAAGAVGTSLACRSVLLAILSFQKLPEYERATEAAKNEFTIHSAQSAAAGWPVDFSFVSSASCKIYGAGDGTASQRSDKRKEGDVAAKQCHLPTLSSERPPMPTIITGR